MADINIKNIRNSKKIEDLINFSILNIDKPSGWTSFDVVNYIRKLFNLKKCGHGGTLDPNVTGVLPIFLGKACKIQEYFMHRDKTYIGKMKMHKDVLKEDLEKGMRKFLGKINQLPPRVSRVKRQIRQREIIRFELVKFDKDKREAEFIAEVEAGTYIRKLIDDLGKNLGIGCQMIELRRIKAGIFSSEDKEFVKISEIEKAFNEYKSGKEDNLRKLLIPAEIIVKLIPSIEIKDEFLGKLENGSPIFEEMLSDKEKAIKIIAKKQPFAVFSGEKMIEIAKFSDKFENKAILAKPEAVL